MGCESSGHRSLVKTVRGRSAKAIIDGAVLIKKKKQETESISR